MKKVLVTGGAGFIGSHLVDKLIEMGIEVVVLDDLSSGKFENWNNKSFLVEENIAKAEDIKSAFGESNNYDTIFHLAAIPRVPYSIENPVKTSDVNIMGTLNILEICRNTGAKMIFASSSSVYGSDSPEMLSESSPLAPKSPYALQKRIGEDFGKMFSELYGVDFIALRLFNVYGPRMTSSLALGKFMDQAKFGEPFTIYGDGEQTRGFCYVTDIVDAFIKAAFPSVLKGFNIFNIASRASYTVNHLARLVNSTNEKKYLPKRQGDPLHTKADISKAEKFLKWSPKISLEEGVHLTKEWYDATS